jgi:hypothetical protein
MTGIGNNHGPSAPAIGSIYQFSLLFGITNDTLNRSRLWRYYRDDAVGTDNIAEPDVNKLNIHKATLIYRAEERQEI